ncbi:MAG: NAD-dependent epimerase/dehydratase family protein [Rhizobiales bacterium]|nr:NAD-dependent epimerase/dehydratase family protein [Hyphomicrobiales bacterium]
MILIERQPSPEGDTRHAIAIFGVGLVGAAVLQAILRHGPAQPTELPLNWTDRGQRAAELAAVADALGRLNSVETLDILWAAGKAGFAADRAQLGSEVEAFGDILQWARAMRHRCPGRALHLHVVSSAGGLFEGQRFVDGASTPQPCRAYGEAKLEQEQLAGHLRSEMSVQIYRPSSIYGFTGIHGRFGLVNALIANAKRHATTRIFGGLDTVRDYVLATDVGDFIARRIIGLETSSRTFLLASGKPASVSQIARIASKVIGAPLYLSLDPLPSNASPITFRPSALPEDWRPTDLETGIRLVMLQLSSSFESGRNARLRQ